MEGQATPQRSQGGWAIIRCPGCGDTRQVTSRQLYRQKTGEATMFCRRCRQPPKTFEPDDPRREALRRWWLEQAGIVNLDGLDAISYVRQHGCPPLVSEIAEAIDDLSLGDE